MGNLQKKTKTTKAVSVFLSLSTAVWLSGAAMFIPSLAVAVTVEELQQQINDLLAQIAELKTQLGQTADEDEEVSGDEEEEIGGLVFSSNLSFGSRGDEVENLQTALATDEEIYPEGLVTGYFGNLTKAAVIRFQEAYADEILEPLGLTKGTGFVGAATREKLNELFGGEEEEEEEEETTGGTTGDTTGGTTGETTGGTTGGTTGETTGGTTGTTTTTAGELKVEAGVQPAASLFPTNSARVPFTVVKFTAPAGKDIIVSSLTIERAGLADDAVFSGIILLDEMSNQVGLAKTLNSVHQAILNESFTVVKGTSKIMTIGGNAQTANSSRGGQVPYLKLIAVDAGADTVAGLPITGTGHTVNETLTLGSVTMARGPLDPNRSDGTAVSKEIGTTGYTFTSVKITAGSQEDVYLTSIKWNQSGSVTSGDLANIKTYVDGTAYDTIVSSDGKYYTTNFAGSGISIAKGASKEAYIKGDVTGGSGRTVDFDVYRRTDLGLKGATFGYGITPPNGASDPTDDSSNFSTGNPWFDASQVSVSSGTMTVSKSTAVVAQNIAVNLADQPLGGFEVETKGEPVQVTSSVYRLSQWTGAGTGSTQDVTNITLVDENGKVVAGPVDIAASSPNVTFSDTITFPIGKHVYTLKGKIGTDFSNNDTMEASTTPSGWTATGQNTGNSITPSPSSGAVTGNTMTIKSGALSISASAIPLAQTVISGSSQFLFASYVFDAGNSGEDVSFSTMPLAYHAPSNPTTLKSCKLYDGTTVLTNGSNIISPTAAASSTTFTFDTPFTVPKGTSKTVGLKCDVAGNATTGNVFAWGFDDAQDPSVTGKTSGQNIVETKTDALGQVMTIAGSGSYSVTDDSTSGYSIVSAGTAGVTLLKLKFSATTEDVNLQRVNFELGGVSASNTPNDLYRTSDMVARAISLYDADNPTTKIGEAIFTTGRTATSTLLTNFKIPAGGSKSMIVKGDIAGISATVGPITNSGDLLIVSYDGGSNGIANGNYGMGASSGSNISPTSADVTPTGVRITKSYPEFAKVDLGTTDRVLQAVTGKSVYRFKVTAKGGDVYAHKFNFTIGSSTTSATTTKYELYAFTDTGFSTADSAFSTTGLLNASSRINGLGVNSPTVEAAQIKPFSVSIYMDKSSATTTYKLPKDSPRYFELRADIFRVETGTGSEFISVKLNGDAAYPSLSGLMANATTIDADTNNKFIWSPDSTSTSVALGDFDYTNGYGVTGLPGTSMNAEIITSAN